MMRRLIIVALATAAGFGCGAIFSGAHRPAPDAIHFSKKSTATNGGVRAGESDPREAAFGTALAELLRPAGDLRGLASLGAALDRLDSAQIAQMLDRLDGRASTIRENFDDRLAWIFARWMKRDPSAASAWVRPRLDALAQDGPAGFTFGIKSRGKLILAWAQADPQAALEYARAHARTGIATELLRKAMSVWPDQDDRRRLALLLDFPAGKARATMLHELHRDWARRDPSAAFASAQTLEPGREREMAIRDALENWADRDGAAAFAKYRALGLADSVLLANILAIGVNNNPSQTVDWLGQLDAAQLARCAPQVVETWAERDPAAALGWALANGVRLAPQSGHQLDRIEHNGLGRSTSGGASFINPLGKALEEKPEATLAWLRALPAGGDRDRVVELAVMLCRHRDQALALFLTLPADAAARTAEKIANLFSEDPKRGREWAASLPAGPARAQAWAGLGAFPDKTFDLPPGPDRDALLSGTLHRSGVVPPPAERLAPLLEIGDPVLRRDMLDEWMESYIFGGGNVDEARAALEAAGIPDDWKQRWRK